SGGRSGDEGDFSGQWPPGRSASLRHVNIHGLITPIATAPLAYGKSARTRPVSGNACLLLSRYGVAMDMHHVRYFLAVARTRHFTRAADECHVTQPSLTRAIKQLEDELGGDLFRAERPQAQLTELGHRMPRC